uniref:Uncharacterized protein n=1 Tax=Kalanchoe fedtschenkoi TaxID=63787 RepID=A0A7N1A6K2_KALFE
MEEHQKQEQAASPAHDLDAPPITSPSSPTTGGSSHSLSPQRHDDLADACRAGCLDPNVADERQRSEVVVSVTVPDKWSQEEMLKDWLDFASFDATLAPKGFDLARTALVAEQVKEAMGSSSRQAYLEMQFSTAGCT